MFAIAQTSIWTTIQDHFVKSLPEYIALLGLFMVAVIANQPHPDVINEWLGAFRPLPANSTRCKITCQKIRDMIAILYKWQYDSLQAFMAARNPPASSQHQLPPPTYTLPPTTVYTAPPTVSTTPVPGKTAVVISTGTAQPLTGNQPTQQTEEKEHE